MSVDHNLPVSNDNSGQRMDAEPTVEQELVPPVKPVRPVSKRRSAVANLATPLHSAVTAIVQTQATTIISNVKLVRAADEKTNNTTLSNPKKDKSRRAATDMQRSFKEVKRRREVESTVQNKGPGGTSTSTLPETGAKGVRPWMATFVSNDGNRTLDAPFGPRQGFGSTNPNEVQAINPGFKSGDNALQMLGHLAGLFMRANSDLEYQCLLVNNRIFVAANDEAKISSFRDNKLTALFDDAAKKEVAYTADSWELRPYLIAAVAAALTKDPKSDATLTPLQKRGAEMLAEYEASHHLDHDVRAGIRSVFNVVQNQALTPRAMVGPISIGTAAAVLGKPEFEYEIILVEPSHKHGWHAEQTLAMVLLKAGWKYGALVAGTKLPCLACWHTLNLLPLHEYRLTLVQKPGLYWSTETLKGLTHVAKTLGIKNVADLEKAFGLTQQHTNDAFTQYMTALREQASLDIDTTRRGLAKHGLTQDQSQRSFHYPNVDPNPVLITGAPYPDQVPSSPRGTYDTPPTSPQANAEDVEMAEYTEKEAEYQKKMEEYQKALNAKKAKKESEQKKDPTGS